MKLGFGFPAKTKVAIEHDGQTETIDRWGQAHVAHTALGGRINQVAAPVQGSIQQADGTNILPAVKNTSLVESVSVVGDKRHVVRTERMQSKRGWGEAQYYMLETDSNGDLVLERGAYSRDIYVSGDPAAWTVASIAAAQTPAVAVWDITNAWLVAHPEYGGTAAQKVSIAVGNMILEGLKTAADALSDRVRTSYWMYQERGYDYSAITIRGFGQSPLHPNVITAFGTGAEPKYVNFGGNLPIYDSYHVFKNVGIKPVAARSVESWLIADTTVNHEVGIDAIHYGANWSVYRCKVLDVHAERPKTAVGADSDSWTTGRNIACGTYASGIAGLLIDCSFYDMCGWEKGYRVDGLWNDGQYGQPPTIYSHNFYMQYDCADASWMNLLSMRPASVSGQMRIGGWQIGCTSIDANVGWQNYGSKFDVDIPQGFLSTNIRNVCTSAGMRPYVSSEAPGGLSWGFDISGCQSTDVDCLAIHGADPNNPTEISSKGNFASAITGPREALWSNLTIWNWGTDANRNIAGMVAAFVNQITIQKRAAEKLGTQTATVDDYSNYVRSLSYKDMQKEIKAVNRFLLSARAGTLEMPLAERTVPQMVIFKPDWRAEGFRLDNPLNLSVKDDLIDGDSLDLRGNYAKWVRQSRSLAALSMTAGGSLEVNSGKVSFTSATVGAAVKTSYCGKLYFNAFDGQVVARGGRFAVSAASAGSIEASGDSEVILGASWTVRSGETLRIVGDMGWIGWDDISGNGQLTIEPGGILEFHATPVLHYGYEAFTSWEYRHDTMLGQTSGASGQFDSIRRKASGLAYVRIRDMVGTPVVGELTTIGKYGRPAAGTIATVMPATIGKIERAWKGRNGTPQPSATHGILLKAGAIVRKTGGALTGSRDMTGPGIAVTDQGAVMGAGFSVGSGKLIFAA